MKEGDPINKTCSCGKLHTTLINIVGFDEMGVWFNCTCDSTLIIPIKWEDYNWRPEGFDYKFYEQLKKVA